MYLTRLLFLLLLTAHAVWAQVAIATKAGLLHRVEGTVLLDKEELRIDGWRFPMLRPGSTLRAADGRAELLLGPMALLWLDHDSELKLLSNDLADVRLRIGEGSAVIHLYDTPRVFDRERKPDSLSVECGDVVVHIGHAGRYRFDCSVDRPGLRLAVRRGRATVATSTGGFEVRRRHAVSLTGPRPADIEPLDRSADGDAFDEWSHQRASRLSKTHKRMRRRVITASDEPERPKPRPASLVLVSHGVALRRRHAFSSDYGRSKGYGGRAWLPFGLPRGRGGRRLGPPAARVLSYLQHGSRPGRRALR